jgi:hypothetical protein
MEPLSANDPKTIGEFRLHARLGAGGMGQVYLGFSPAGRAVAIKVIHQQFATNQEFLRRFSHEVAAASAVGGMYTAPVVDYDLKSATPWLATAYVPGPTLATYIAKHGALPEAALWRLAAGLTEALRAVHAKGLIHRDLKPANVLLADSGPHVIDFGISRAASSLTHLTGTGMAIGTPGYMSPEQAQVLEVGPPSDVFSLGCVLAYAGCGHQPFEGGNPAAVLFKIVSGTPDLAGLASPGFRQVIEACLCKDPTQRPTPTQLITMISGLGPAAPLTLGSFWSPEVARVIAAEQAAQTPSGLTPPPPPSGPVAPAKLAGPAGPSGPVAGAEPVAGAGWAATAAASASAPATPASAAAPAASAAPAAAPGVGAAGHAPMIPDGYSAEARRAAVPSNPPFPASFPPPVPSQTYGQPLAFQDGQQAVHSNQRSGQVSYEPAAPADTPASAPFGPNPYAAKAPAGQGTPNAGPTPPRGGESPYQGQPYQAPQPYPGRPYPGRAQPDVAGPIGQYPIGQYSVGQRRPTAAEVPPRVRSAIGLMRAGAVVTVLNLLLGFVAFGRYNTEETNAQALGHTTAANSANTMAGSAAVGICTDFLGLICWLLLAMAARRGQGWPRVAGTVLLAIYTVIGLIIMIQDKGAPGFVFTTILVWAMGVAAAVPLWSQQARAFAQAWRKR